MKLPNWHNLEAMGRTSCNLQRSTMPFRDIFVLCIGMFWQILLVLLAFNRTHKINAWFKRSRFYFLFKRLFQNDNMRTQSLHKDPHATSDALWLQKCLLQLGNWKVQSVENPAVHLLTFVRTLRNKSEIIKNVIPHLQSKLINEELIAQRAIITI